MKLNIRGRRQGTTTELVKKAIEGDFVIVTWTRESAEYIRTLIKDDFSTYRAPIVMSYREYIKLPKHLKDRPIVIDGLNYMLDDIFGTKVEEISIQYDDFDV